MFRRLANALEYLLHRRRLEDELDEELRSSFDMVVDRYVAAGLSSNEARRAARLEFEGVEQVKEQVRDRLAGSGVGSCLQDVRYAWRTLWRRKSFAAVALITLAVGIGVTTAVFSVFYGVLLHPLPYANPDRLVVIWSSVRASGSSRGTFSGPGFAEIERRNRSLAGIAGIWAGASTFTGRDPEQVKFAFVTHNFFDVLGVRAALGRTFTPDQRGGDASAIVLSDGFFRRRFAGDTSLLGKVLPMREWAPSLYGVLPADFRLPFSPDANVPAEVQAFMPFASNIYDGPRRVYYIRVIGRLKPGVSVSEAQLDLDRVAAEIRSAIPDLNTANLQIHIAGMHADGVRDVQPALAALFAGSAFVLLVCCVNVASLLLARASERRREIALRLTLGASRGRILRQLLTEGGLLCLLGGVAGVAVAWAAFQALLAIRPERLARIDDTGLSWPALAFAALASLVAAILFGLAPALECFRLDLIETLRAGGRGWLGRFQRRAGASLVVLEIAVGFMLVTGAALASRTLAKIEQIRPGFEPRGLLTFQVMMGAPLDPGISPADVNDWEAQVSALPGVDRVGCTSHLPLDDFPNWFGRFTAVGSLQDDPRNLVADFRAVTPGYLQAMGSRLIEGRYFDAHDTATSRPVSIVDEMLARTVWPGQSALGKQVQSQHAFKGAYRAVVSDVVGVVEHMRNHSVTQQVRGELYVPWAQSPRSPLTFVVRAAGSPLALVAPIRRLLHQRDPDVAMAKTQVMTDYVARDIAPASFTAALAAIFGVMALLLAATGVYGVLHYQVSRRLPEMGIRMALGAGAREVVQLVLRETSSLAALGVFLGACGALAVARWLGALVYGVSARDPLSFAAAVLLLPAAAFLGCWRPARRAATANPAETIRNE